MFDKTLAEKFLIHINGMTDEEIQKRAENARSSGMEAIIDEWVDPIEHRELNIQKKKIRFDQP